MDGHINFILEGLTSVAQNSCHGNAGCLTTGPLSLQIMVPYFNNENVYTSRLPGHVTQFWRKYVKG